MKSFDAVVMTDAIRNFKEGSIKNWDHLYDGVKQEHRKSGKDLIEALYPLR
jgi:hypothetical protein